MEGGTDGVVAAPETLYTTIPMTDNAPSIDRVSTQQAANAIYQGTALAPMVRASTTPLRILALNYGADIVYTEELVDRSLIQSERVVNKELGTIDFIKTTVSKKATKRLLGQAPVLLRIDPNREQNKLVGQIGTGEPELAVQAARKIVNDVASIDINMGCPKKFSVSGGMGSALLKDADRACRIVAAVREAIDKPVSVKIRLLEDVTSTVELLNKLITAGANAVAVHGRRTGDESQSPADWATLEAVVMEAKKLHPDIPVLINGDFYTRSDWTAFIQKSGADGVLLARPALYNMSIFCKPNDESVATTKNEYGYNSPLLHDRTKVVQDYLRLAAHYQVHFKNIKYVTCEFLTSRRAPAPRVPFLPQRWPGGQTIATVCSCRSVQDMCTLWKVDLKESIVESQQEQGEHKYLDSYFLDKNGGKDAEELGSSRAKKEEYGISEEIDNKKQPLKDDEAVPNGAKRAKTSTD